MADLKIAFQRWEPGQVLEPEHFRANEDAVAGHARLVGELQGLPFYGIGRLAWKEAAFARGTIVISSLIAVFPSGQAVSVLDGHPALSDLDLTRIKGTTITLFLHLLREPATGRYDDDPKLVTRLYPALQLSMEPSAKGARESLPFAVIEVDTLQKTYRLSEDFVPPLLQVGNNPFLAAHLAALEEVLRLIEANFAAQFEDPLFRGDRMAAARRCEVESVRLRTLLLELGDKPPAGLYRHPYVVFDAIRSFYLELCAMREEAPEIFRYTHEDLADCFGCVIDAVKARAVSEPVRSPSLAFERKADDQPFVAKPIPQSLARDHDVYLVVERPEAAVPFSGIKLASPARLDDVIRLSLHGVNFAPIASPPPFRHSFGPYVDFHKIETSGDEWKRAMDARALAYRAWGPQRSVRVALYWRKREGSPRP